MSFSKEKIHFRITVSQFLHYIFIVTNFIFRLPTSFLSNAFTEIPIVCKKLEKVKTTDLSSTTAILFFVLQTMSVAVGSLVKYGGDDFQIQVTTHTLQKD